MTLLFETVDCRTPFRFILRPFDSFRDFILFAQAYGSTNTTFDLDGDGTVAFRDFVMFAAAFGG